MSYQIFVSCLAAYNNGDLHGAWIPTSSDVDEMQEAVNEILESSPSEDAEEWAIHDFEMPCSISEYTSLETIAAIAEFMENAWDTDLAEIVLKETDGDLQEAESMMENWCGHYASLREYAEHIVSECYDLPEIAERYFDYDSFGRDLSYDHRIVETDSGIHVFHY